tara:strand:- start:664 stop:996 length:333 start_codon:yes stop_codon:yes gene_type:complete
MPVHLRAIDHLSPEIISLVVTELAEKRDEDWAGGTVYFPSALNPTSSVWPKEEKAYKRALSVVAVIDGFSYSEAAALAGINQRLVRAWVERYRDEIEEALRSVREEKDDG